MTSKIVSLDPNPIPYIQLCQAYIRLWQPPYIWLCQAYIQTNICVIGLISRSVKHISGCVTCPQLSISISIYKSRFLCSVFCLPSHFYEISFNFSSLNKGKGWHLNSTAIQLNSWNNSVWWTQNSDKCKMGVTDGFKLFVKWAVSTVGRSTLCFKSSAL